MSYIRVAESQKKLAQVRFSMRASEKRRACGNVITTFPAVYAGNPISERS
jgi:hypothetical protein